MTQEKINEWAKDKVFGFEDWREINKNLKEDGRFELQPVPNKESVRTDIVTNYARELIDMMFIEWLETPAKEPEPNIDWEQRRYEIAKDIVLNYNVMHETDYHGSDEKTKAVNENVCNWAIGIADELIKQLKK